MVAGREGCKKTHFFSSYPVSDAQETGRNSPYDLFRPGFFLLLAHSVLGLPVLLLCLEMLERICFDMTITCSVGLLHDASK